MTKPTKADKLAASVGANIEDSIGVRGGKPAGAAPPPPAKDPRFEGTEKIKNAEKIPVDRIVADENQPRKEFDEESIEVTARSLKEHGQLQSCLVRYDQGRKVFVMLDGERRLRAARRAGIPKLLCLIETNELDDSSRLIRQVIANDVREDLNDVDRANALKFLMDSLGLNAQQAGERLFMNKFRVSRCLTLLDLAPEVQDLVKAGDLPASTATKLATLEDPADQVETAKRIVDEGMSRESADREIAIVAGRREEERAEADPGPPADGVSPGGGVAVAERPAKVKDGKKSKPEKKAARRPEKLKAVEQYVDRDRGIKVTAERKKGIELDKLLLALEHYAADVRERIKARHIGRTAEDLLRN